jgi:hypothetical protein
LIRRDAAKLAWINVQEHMARGPNGERRKGDVAQRALQVLRIATGQEEEDRPSGRRKSGFAGAEARKNALSSQERTQIAKQAAEARWSKKKGRDRGLA